MIHIKQNITEEELKVIQTYKLEKQNLINSSQPNEKFRAPNPQGSTVYPEENFLEFTVLQNNKPIKLQTYRFPPADNKAPRALYIQIHGLGGHSNQGAHIAKAFSEVGFCVLAFDHRGYGKSEGLRGYIESYEIHLQDSRQFIDKIEQIYGQQIHKFIGGLSMGGLTSYSLTLAEPERFRGAILLAPALKNNNNTFVKGLINVFGWALPTWQIIKLTYGLGNKNPQVNEDINSDPYVFMQNQRPKTIKSLFEGMNADKTFGQYKSPYIYVQGGVEKLVDPDACFELFEKAQTKDKEIIFCRNMWHDVWHEREIIEILPKILQWACDRI